ncbi:hypothetical protein PAL_GLEAN10018891 [Pteropus alecto]|uniref:Uncharacterized protein n=1 Tax=Pteropus alecto TaxID=9402 RepID=L5L0Y0_PTEAL|nr:hypothetical protein PAL_GLEAN10018891 [Pteropus alecto]
MGNTVHRTLPGTPGSPAPEAGAGVLLSLGDPLGDFRRATLALEPPASSGLESPVPPGPQIRVRRAAGLCAPGRRVPRPGYLGDPRPCSLGFGQMRERASGGDAMRPLAFVPAGGR